MYSPTAPVMRPGENVTPDIKFCPCCKAPTCRANPECFQTRDADGTLLHSVLHWACQVCGCEWEHGQFASKETRSTSPFISIAAGRTMTIDGRKFDVLEVTEPAPNPSGKYDIKIVLS